MNTAFWISRRLRLGGASGNSAATVIAVAGVALAVIVMEFTLAVVVGFKDGIRDKLMGFDAQISVEAPLPAGADDYQTELLEYTPALDSVLHEVLPSEARMRLSLRQPGMLKTDDNFQGVVFIGQSPDADFAFEKANMVDGAWPVYSADSCVNDIVMSLPVARSLGLAVGDKVFSSFIVDGNVKIRRHRIAGLYQSNFGEYDNSVVYASLSGLQRLLGVDSITAGRIDIRGLSLDDIQNQADMLHNALLAAAASRRLDRYYPVSDIINTGALYFNWLALLDTNVTVIFILMLAVAGFTLVSSLFILILERVPMIGVLRTMGASGSLVRDIFVDLGMRLVGLGIIVGNVVGIGLLLLQKYTSVIPLDPRMYYLSSVPVEIRPWAFVALNIGVVAVSALILLIPARVAAKTDPAKAVEAE